HCQETYAWGLRNPFRFSMDSNAPGVSFFINDVGQNNWEEIDDGQIGIDYGWNCREGRHVNNSGGPCNPVPAGMVDPIFEYAHGASIPGTTSPSTCDAITGGAFVPTGIWPNANGTYVAADYTCGVIFQLSKPATTWVASNFVGGLGSSSATSLLFGPYQNTQGLYYTTYAGGGQIWVISYQEGNNTAPTANGSAQPAAGALPLSVTFSAAGSSDPDAGDSLTFFWDFGD
ncbi:MAG: sugar dehydrogenase, partial [Betaproteobacteria bacterium]